MQNYVIITPAHNEAAFIEKTIASVTSQTVPPRKWVLVDDASTDSTGEIMRGYAARCCFMEVVKVARVAGRDFRNKVRAFNEGLTRTRGLACEFIGNLDADISMEPDYFKRIVHEFRKNPRLGIAGGMVHSYHGDEFISQEVSLDSVAGAVQLF